MNFLTFTHQSSKGFLIILLSNLRKQVNHLWVFIPIFFTKKRSVKLLYLVFGVIGVFLIISLVKTIIRYKTFRFKVDDENFIVKEGLFQKKETSIPFRKIVNVNLKQNVVQQFIDVFQVEIETAGSDKLEIKIEALSKENALALKEIVLQNNVEEAVDNEIAEIEYLQKISIKELIKVAVTENHLQSFLLIITFFIGIFSKIKEYFNNNQLKEIILDTAKNNKDTILNSIGMLFLMAIVSSLLVSFGRIFIKHFKLKTLVRNNAIEIKQGLFDYKSNTIKTSRVQYIKIVTNPLKKLYGIFNVSFLQASSGLINLKKAINTVGVTHKQLKKIITVFYNDLDLIFSSDFVKPHPYYKAQVLFKGLVILLAINLLIFFVYDVSAKISLLASLFLSIVIVFYAIIQYNKASFNYNNTHIQVNAGVISSEVLYFEYYKIQKITLSQTIFQKKRNITDLYLQTASGDIKIPCVKYDKAIEMYNHFLLTVEKSSKKWM